MILFVLAVVASVSAKEPPYNAATDAIIAFKNRTGGPIGTLTTTTGRKVTWEEAENSLNQDLILNRHFMESITALVREKIPERLVHAKGTGAFGYFTVTHDFTDICMADFLNEMGKKTNVAVRFSSTQGQRGSPDLKRDIHGIAVKFDTLEGIFDLVSINVPVFFSKDPHDFHGSVRARRECPRTNLKTKHTAWDFLSLREESYATFLRVFADRTIPASFTNMEGHAIHTFQLVNEHGVYHFCRFHWRPCKGVKTLTATEANRLSSMDNDYLIKDFLSSVMDGEEPSWTLTAQVLTMEDVKRIGFEVFDPTFIISTKEFPERPIGKMTLNRAAYNFFAEIEQLAFCPGNIVPGIVGVPGNMYKGRVLAYRQAQIHRLGINFNKIPVNCPSQATVLTYNRGGVGPVGDNEFDAPNYYPNTFNGPQPYKPKFTPVLLNIKETKPSNLNQTRTLYAEDFSADERTRLIENLCEDLSLATERVQKRVVKGFYKIHEDLGNRVRHCLNLTNTCDTLF